LDWDKYKEITNEYGQIMKKKSTISGYYHEPSSQYKAIVGRIHPEKKTKKILPNTKIIHSFIKDRNPIHRKKDGIANFKLGA